MENLNDTTTVNHITLLTQAANAVKKHLTVLDSIITIFETLENSKFDEEEIQKVADELRFVEAYLGCSQIQAILFSAIFGIQHRSGVSVTFEMISNHFGESLLHVLKYMKELNVLIKNDLLNQMDNGKMDSSYSVNRKVISCIIEDQPLHDETAACDTETVFMKFHELFSMAMSNQILRDDYLGYITGIEKDYSKNEVIGNVTATYPDNLEARIFVYNLCDRIIHGADYQDEDDSSAGFSYKIFPLNKAAEVKKAFADQSFCVFKDDYAGSKYVLKEAQFGRRHEIVTLYSLTRKGIQKFFGSESNSYTVDEDISSGIEQIKQFLLCFSQSFESRRSHALKLKMLGYVEHQFCKLPFLKKVKKLVPDAVDRYVLLACCSNFVHRNAGSNLTDTLLCLFGSDKQFFKQVHEYKDEKSFLISEGFVVLEKTENIKQTELEVSDSTLELIYGKDADLYKNSASDENVIEYEKIGGKTLFYPDEITSQIDMLRHSLERKNLQEMQKRLEAKNLPKGVAVLLYGAPGTGKTESVYQIAKATHRKIYHVDIAETKSMWFGESEKLIKRVFVNYKRLCKTCSRHNENTPILLFNEADAIISKRKNVSSGNTAQTENAIQNIILEQMENLDGIMIATTNLCDNMDSAFERRFLFKIKFDRPGVKERSQIWKNKISFLSDDEAEAIAGKYDFTGGEIDNIVRKCEINEVITGLQPEFDQIDELCRHERLASENSHKIGFC